MLLGDYFLAILPTVTVTARANQTITINNTDSNPMEETMSKDGRHTESHKSHAAKLRKQTAKLPYKGTKRIRAIAQEFRRIGQHFESSLDELEGGLRKIERIKRRGTSLDARITRLLNVDQAKRKANSLQRIVNRKSLASSNGRGGSAIWNCHD